MAQDDFVSEYVKDNAEFVIGGGVDTSINHRKKIAALVGSIFLTIMAAVGVALVLSGVFAPFGVSMLGAVYLAASLGIGSAAIAGACAYFSAKFFPTNFNVKKTENIVIGTTVMIGIFIGASLGALLTAAGLIMAAPAILPAIGIACGFAFLGAIIFRPLGKKIYDFIEMSDPYKHREEDIDALNNQRENKPKTHSSTETDKPHPHPISRQGRPVPKKGAGTEAEVEEARRIRPGC